MKYQLPKRLTFRMMVNQGIDSAMGMIPFIGDIFDMGFKANRRNVRLLQQHLLQPQQAQKSDCCFLITIFFLVVVLPILLIGGIVAALVCGVLASQGRLQG
eukprot:jgi/Chrzof1/10477/Cz05g00020.t1